MLSQEDQIIAALRRITRAIDLHSRVLSQEHGLTAPQLAVLRELTTGRSTSPGAIAKAIHLSQPTVVGILNRLEFRGLIVRSREGRDRRGVTVRLTPVAEAMLASAPSLLQDQFRDGLSRMQVWEQTQMLSTLQRIAAMMDADDLVAAPVLTSGPAGAYVDEIRGLLGAESLHASTATAPSPVPAVTATAAAAKAIAAPGLPIEPYQPANPAPVPAREAPAAAPRDRDNERKPSSQFG